VRTDINKEGREKESHKIFIHESATRKKQTRTSLMEKNP